MNDKDDHLQNARSSARRRLIRGTFAAPAILALHSGSAFAQASATSCLVRQNASPVTPAPAPTNADDTYFRYQLWVIRRGNGNIVSSWIKGADLSVYIRNGLSPFLASGSWWKFNPDPAQNKLVGSATTTAPTPTGNQTFTQSGAWVVLRVDKDGALVGAGVTDVNGTGSPVGDSCWNSFAIATQP